MEDITKESIQEKSNLIHNGEYEILSEYKSHYVKIQIKHKICGNTFSQTAYKHLYQNKCPVCFGHNRLSKEILQEKSDEIDSLLNKMRWRSPEFLSIIFEWCKNSQAKMNDNSQAKLLIDAGNLSIESKNWERVAEINRALINLMPKGAVNEVNTRIGFGL
jgi:molecular chaperone DnaK